MQTAEDKCFFLKSADSLVNDKTYTIEAYAMSDRDPVAALLIIYNNDNISTDVDSDSGEIAIEKIVQTINDDGESVFGIIGWNRSGKYKGITSANVNGIENYHPGDVILVAANSRGEVVNVRKLFDAISMKMIATDNKTEASNPSSSNYIEKNRWFFGNVFYRSNDVMRFQISKLDIPNNPIIGGNVRLENHYLPLFKILRFDTEKKKITVISANDILDYLTTGEYSKAFVSTRYGEGRLMVIYE